MRSKGKDKACAGPNSKIRLIIKICTTKNDIREKNLQFCMQQLRNVLTKGTVFSDLQHSCGVIDLFPLTGAVVK